VAQLARASGSYPGG